MKTPKEKLRLNKKQTTRLLELSLRDEMDTREANADSQKEQLLLDTLRSKLPLDRILERSLPALIQSLAQELRSLSGASLGDLLTHPRTPIEALMKIKDHSKERGASAQSEAEREVALAVYYAAIASALTYHNTKISEHSTKNLRGAFERLARDSWIPTSLVTLFRTASL